MSNLRITQPSRTLDEQRAEYAQRRGIAMPLAGMVAWSLVAIAGAFLQPGWSAMVLFCATGSIVYLGMFLSKLTGEDFLDKTRPKNVFDGLFFHAVAMSVLVYAIAIPFFKADITSLPLSVGILTGLMWLPLSWILEHWVGVFHAVSRVLLVTLAWYLFPRYRFCVIPGVIVAIYLMTILILEARWRRIHSHLNV